MTTSEGRASTALPDALRGARPRACTRTTPSPVVIFSSAKEGRSRSPLQQPVECDHTVTRSRSAVYRSLPSPLWSPSLELWSLEKRRGEERRGSPLPALEELWTNQTTKGVITMAEKKITVNAVSIAQSKCYKETRLPIGFEVMKNTGTSYKIRITCGDPAVRWEGGPHYLFGKQLFTTREAKAMFDMIRMMRQLNWMKPAGEAPIASILSAEYHDGAWCLNELNIPD